MDSLSKKKQRLVTWCADVLSKSLKQIVAHRIAIDEDQKQSHSVEVVQHNLNCSAEIINQKDVRLPEEVASQLQLFVAKIASLHSEDLNFHNFERTR